MTDRKQDTTTPLRSTLGLLERETARRAKGSHPGMMRLDDAELKALLDLLRREVGAVTEQSASADSKSSAPVEEVRS